MQWCGSGFGIPVVLGAVYKVRCLDCGFCDVGETGINFSRTFVGTKEGGAQVRGDVGDCDARGRERAQDGLGKRRRD